MVGSVYPSVGASSVSKDLSKSDLKLETELCCLLRTDFACYVDLKIVDKFNFITSQLGTGLFNQPKNQDKMFCNDPDEHSQQVSSTFHIAP